MSILIKGMDMPKICELCPFWVMRTDGRWCRTLHKIIDISKDRADDCPLIEIDIVRCSECMYCHECDACGISDLVGIKCPDEYGFDNLPNGCPLEEVDDIAFGLYKAYIDGIGGERRE